MELEPEGRPEVPQGQFARNADLKLQWDRINLPAGAVGKNTARTSPHTARVLFQTAQKAQDDYDKAVTALSGGAIRLSLTFLKDVVGTRMLVDVIWVALRLGKLGF